MDFLLARRSDVADRSVSQMVADLLANIETVVGRSRLSTLTSHPGRSVSATTLCSPQHRSGKKSPASIDARERDEGRTPSMIWSCRRRLARSGDGSQVRQRHQFDDGTYSIDDFNDLRQERGAHSLVFEAAAQLRLRLGARGALLPVAQAGEQASPLGLRAWCICASARAANPEWPTGRHV